MSSTCPDLAGQDEEPGHREDDAQNQVNPAPTAGAEFVNAVRGDHVESPLTIAARPWKNWNTPTIASMTPAKRVKPVAHGFLVPDPIGRFIVAIQLGVRAGGSQGPVVKSSVSAWYLSLPHLWAVSYTHLRAHETVLDLVCRLLLE